MPVNITDAELVFFNFKGVIALYSKSSHSIVEAYSFKRPKTTHHCSVKLWIYDGELCMAHTTETATVRIDSVLGGDFFLDGNEIVIGVGDMRDGIAKTYKFDLATLDPSNNEIFIIKHIDLDEFQICCSRELQTPDEYNSDNIELC